MKILLTNDDGYEAEGINVLFEGLKNDHDVTMIAPAKERSTTGHSLTLDKPLRVKQVSANKFTCSGFPADCVLLGIGNLLDQRPDLVISGVNRGANLGQDIYYSGTVAAAREAAFHQIPSIAISTVIDFENPVGPFHYSSALGGIRSLINSGFIAELPPMSHFNMNVPDLETDQIRGFEFSDLGIRKYSEDITQRKDMRGNSYYWVGGYYQGHEEIKGTDCLAVSNRLISVSILNFRGPIADETGEWADRIASLKL